MDIDLNKVPDFKSLDLAKLKAEAETNPDAMFLMAHVNVIGYGLTPLNLKEADMWARKGAAKGHALCKAFIALNLSSSEKESQKKKGRELFERIAESIKTMAAKDNPYAQNYLGVMYFRGLGVSHDYNRAAQWFEKAAYKEHASAQRALAICYLNGKGRPKDSPMAELLLKAAANKGHAEAQCDLGYFYMNDQGKSGANLAEGAAWYRKAADQGYILSQTNLGICFLNGQGVEKNNTEGFRLLSLSAEKGERWAQFTLGSCYYRSDFIGCIYKDERVEQNPALSFEWIKQAAENGVHEAQNALGCFYSQGHGVEKNAREAYKWFKKSAQQGNVVALCNLGDCYVNGCGVKRDVETAKMFYKQAVKKGNADAACKLGYLLGVHLQEYPEAIIWYKKAAAKGHVIALYNLGCCALAGLGGPKDQTKAIRYFQDAAVKGHVESAKALTDLFGKLAVQWRGAAKELTQCDPGEIDFPVICAGGRKPVKRAKADLG